MGNIFNKDQAQQEFVSKTAFYDKDGKPLFIEKTQMTNGSVLFIYTSDIVKAILLSTGVTDKDGNPLFQTKSDLNTDVTTILKTYKIIDNTQKPLFATVSDYNTLNTTVNTNSSDIATLQGNYTTLSGNVTKINKTFEDIQKEFENIKSMTSGLYGMMTNDVLGSNGLRGKLENQLSYNYKFQQLNVGNDWSILTNNQNLCVAKGKTQVVCLDSTGNIVYGKENSEINKANGITFTPNTSTTYNGFLPTSTTATTPAGYIRFNAL